MYPRLGTLALDGGILLKYSLETRLKYESYTVGDLLGFKSYVK